MRGAASGAVESTSVEGARVIPLPERALLERHRGGDAAAFPELVASYRAQVHGYLVRAGIPAADRDDLFQDVFLKVHRASSESPPTGPVAPWLFAIVVNTVRSHFRKARVRSIVALDGDASEAAPAETVSPDREVETARRVAWMEAQIARLPLEQREALLLCAVEGLELRDAAEAIGAPVDTVKTRLRRARLALAEARARLMLREEREESR